ncbi:MAG TPA: hypothetical protein VHE35_26920 [Kofleriaceae bacterium]|nr:hypothetical protein [Kofleriaceae bacterium]
MWGPSATLFTVGGLQLVQLAFEYYAAHDHFMTSELAEGRVEVVLNLAIVAALLGCGVAARRAPLLALTVGAIGWMLAEGVVIHRGGYAILSAWLLVTLTIILVFLLRALVAAAGVRRLRARLAPPRPAPLPVARLRR